MISFRNSKLLVKQLAWTPPPLGHTRFVEGQPPINSFMEYRTKSSSYLDVGSPTPLSVISIRHKSCSFSWKLFKFVRIRALGWGVLASWVGHTIDTHHRTQKISLEVWNFETFFYRTRKVCPGRVLNKSTKTFCNRKDLIIYEINN